jgi:hypothetical protein
MYPYIYFSNPVSIANRNVLPVVPWMKMQSLFSDNSLVCYKRGSLASCGGANTVSNSRAKARRT